MASQYHKSDVDAPHKAFAHFPVGRAQKMSKFLSVSPQAVFVAPGYDVPTSEVEDLIAGREREGGKVMYQAIFKSLLRGEKDVNATAVGQNLFGNGSPLL